MSTQGHNIEELITIGKKAKEAASLGAGLSTEAKNRALLSAADTLTGNAGMILEENRKDMENGRKNGMKESLLDRLQLSSGRISAMAEGMRRVAMLDDPIGSVMSMKKRPNGLLIGQKRVPLGVIGIIYEARPNVTADSFALTFKTGNAVILKGGSDAICSNRAIVTVIRRALGEEGLCPDMIQLIEATDHETTQAFMKMDDYVDLLIPRGGRNLIQAVRKNSSIPVIETGVGNCHVYVDASADIPMAVSIIVNAKTQRTGVCNAVESLVINSAVLDSAAGPVAEALTEKGVEIRADERAFDAMKKACPEAKLVPATEEDYGTEYLDLIISVKTVDSTAEAIRHINHYNTGHSETIVTNSWNDAQMFLDGVDAAAVYLNASTRFTDGGEFGLGAEIGISTQKLHARGPMGLTALTTYKYIILGNGQIRPDNAGSGKVEEPTCH